MGSFAIIFALDVMVSTMCLYFATKLSFVRAPLKPLAGIVVIVSILSMIPIIGWGLGLIAFVYLLMRISDADLMDCIWVVVFIKVISFIMISLIMAIFS